VPGSWPGLRKGNYKAGLQAELGLPWERYSPEASSGREIPVGLKVLESMTGTRIAR